MTAAAPSPTSAHVVIVNYRSHRFVSACVRALDPAWCRSVVVVDNSRDADELAELRSIESAAPLRVVDAGGNIGFGAGVDLGVSLVDWRDGEAVWILNPDTVPEPAAARRLLGHLAASGAAAASPAVVTGDDAGTIWFTGGEVDERTGSVRHWDYLQPFDRTASEPYRTEFLCGAAPMFTRSAWEALGGFDDDLFLYWEDVELSLRARDLGLRFDVVPAAVVWHAVGGTSGESGQSRAFYRWSMRNRVIVMRRRVGLRALFGVKGAAVTAKLALAPLREREARWAKFGQGLVGLAEGLRG